jgi:oligopeptide/dipeptide ABC transporter ATP-binding protein
MSGKSAEKRELLKLVGVKRHFQVRGGIPLIRKPLAVRAVDGVDLTVTRGETLSLVGESGSGKTTLGRVALGLQPATAGTVTFDGRELKKLSATERRALRKRMQIVFQDPFGSLNPRLPIGDQIEEGLLAHKLGEHAAREKRVREVLDLVGLDPNYASRYPHEFSGGQRQRIGIARALALDPSLIVLDEPVSALDVSIQAGVVNLLEDLQDRLGLSYLFIAHDLSVVRHISDVIAVMYLGKLMEIGPAEELYMRPAHPYTQALLSAVPEPDPHLERMRHRIVLEGDVPSPIDPPSGCRFRTRCPKAKALCAEEEPALIDRGQGHPVACHFAEVVPVTIASGPGSSAAL